MRTRSIAGFLACAVVLASVGCSPPTDSVLECEASGVHHVFRIGAAAGQVDDLAFVPPKHGEAEVAEGRYVFRFFERRDRYELIVRINRSTGQGTRELFDDEQQPIRGQGGTDAIVCRPR